MDFRVGRRTSREARLIDMMYNIFGYGFGLCIEDRGLIHVIPKALDAVAIQISIERAPPGTCLLAREVWKDARTRPYTTGINRTIRILNEVIAGDTTIVW